MQQQTKGAASNIGNGDVDTVQPQLQDDAGNVGGSKDNSPGDDDV